MPSDPLNDPRDPRPVRPPLLFRDRDPVDRDRYGRPPVDLDLSECLLTCLPYTLLGRVNTPLGLGNLLPDLGLRSNFVKVLIAGYWTCSCGHILPFEHLPNIAICLQCPRATSLAALVGFTDMLDRACPSDIIIGFIILCKSHCATYIRTLSYHNCRL